MFIAPDTQSDCYPIVSYKQLCALAHLGCAWEAEVISKIFPQFGEDTLQVEPELDMFSHICGQCGSSVRARLGALN